MKHCKTDTVYLSTCILVWLNFTYYQMKFDGILDTKYFNDDHQSLWDYPYYEIPSNTILFSLIRSSTMAQAVTLKNPATFLSP